MSASSTFMRNKKIASILKEAIDSPVGSTKRERAKQLVAILQKTSVEADGQGGPGDSKYPSSAPGSSYFLTKTARTDPNYSTVGMHSTPPAPRQPNPFASGGSQQALAQTQQQQGQQISAIQSAMQGQPQTSGQPGAIPQSNYNPMVPMPDMASAYGNIDPIPQSAAAPSQSSVQPGAMANLQKITVPTSNPTNGQGGPGGGPESSWMMPSYSVPTPSSNLTLGGNAAGVTAPQMSSALSTGMSKLPTTPAKNNALTGTPSGGLLTGAFGATPNQQYEINGTMTTPASFPSLYKTPAPTPAPAPQAQQSTPAATTPPAGGTPADTASNTGTSTDTTGGANTSGGAATQGGTGTDIYSKLGIQAPQAIKDAVTNNLGASGFASNAMADPALLKEIFPNLGETPVSPTLSAAVNGLKTTLDKQYNIQGLQSQLQQMIAGGVTLGPMLQTYIQNKDQSLDEINQQRQAAQEQLLHSDTGNPGEANIWGQYLGYLNTLYTNQNATYADFYNKSIGMYNNALTALNTTMSSAISQYNNDLNLQTQLTQADYNNMRQSLMDMYTAVQNAPQQQIDLSTLQAQLNQAQGAVAGGITGVGSGDWTGEYKKLVDSGILFGNTKASATGGGNVGELLPDVTDLGSAIQTIVSDNPKVGLNGALYILGNSMQKSITAAGNSPDKSIAATQRFNDMIMKAVGSGYISQDTANSMVASLAAAASKSVHGYLDPTTGTNKGNATNANLAKQALLYAWDGEGAGWFSKKIPTQAEFSKKYQGKLSSAMLDQIYTAVNTARSTIAQGGLNTGGMTTDQIIKQYTDQVRALNDPTSIADYVSNLIAGSLGGSSTQDYSVPMSPAPQVDPNAAPDTSTTFTSS